jgi:hypothetical protein
MATATRPHRQQSHESLRVARPQRRWRRLALAILLVLAAAVGLLPQIAARTPLLAWGVRTAARWDGSLSVRSASLGWFSPLAVEGIDLRDAQDRPVLELAGVTSEKSLWQILGSLRTPGSFRLEKPKLTLVLGENGSNLEDLLAKYQTAGGGGPRTGFNLEIVDGSITVVDPQLHESWELRNVQLALCVSPEFALPEKIELAASLADAKQPGRLSLRFHLQPREAPAPDPQPVLEVDKTQGQLFVEAEAIPAAMFERLAGRWVPGIRLSGRVGTKLDLQWTGPDHLALEADIQVRNLQVASPWGNFSEPLAGLAIAGRWDAKAGRWQADTATLRGSGLSIDAQNIVLARSVQGLWDLSGGHALLGPELRLDTAAAARLRSGGASPSGIDAAACQAMLKFITPAVADATDARGAFSIELEGYHIPLSEPAKMEIAGRLTVHALEVAPGPMVREMAPLLTQVEPVRIKPQSVIPFRMVGGRIYHQGIEMQFSDLTIRTYGSVGLDQSLAVMAEMPIPPKWVASTPIAASLGNQVLRLPIAGTLSRPQLDRNELAKASRQLLGRAAQDTLQTQVGKQLERLLAPPR